MVVVTHIIAWFATMDTTIVETIMLNITKVSLVQDGLLVGIAVVTTATGGVAGVPAVAMVEFQIVG